MTERVAVPRGAQADRLTRSRLPTWTWPELSLSWRARPALIASGPTRPTTAAAPTPISAMNTSCMSLPPGCHTIAQNQQRCYQPNGERAVHHPPDSLAATHRALVAPPLGPGQDHYKCDAQKHREADGTVPGCDLLDCLPRWPYGWFVRPGSFPTSTSPILPKPSMISPLQGTM